MLDGGVACPAMSDPCYRVAVRTLCEFAAKQGDLDLRFTPSPTSQQGIAGHQAVAARRGPAYRAELPLSGEYRQLSVRGRADGYDPELLLLEEIKTLANKQDVPYQSLMKVYLAERIDRERRRKAG